MSFKTLDNRRLRTMIPEGRETNEMNLTSVPAHWLERVSRLQHSGREGERESSWRFAKESLNFCLGTNQYPCVQKWMTLGKETSLKLLANQEQSIFQKMKVMPSLVWLCGLSAGLQIRRLLVGFPVRTHAWVARSLVRGVWEANDQDVSLACCFSPSLSPNLPLSLEMNI